jgi:hypothetical protein
MNPSKFSESVLRKIKARQIKPRSKWQFIARNIGFWGIYNLSVLLGAGGVSVIIFALLESDFDLFSELSGSGTSLILSWLPMFWIVYFVAFVSIAMWGLRKTKKGYRFSIHALLMTNVTLSILLGGLIYGIGGGEQFEKVFAENAPMYVGMQHRMQEMWTQPEEGRLSGTILEVQKEDIIILDDFSHQQWIVDVADTPKRRPLRIGTKVKVLGEKTGEHLFTATMVRPLIGRRGQFMGKEDHKRLRSPEEREQFMKDHPEIQEKREQFQREHPELMKMRKRIEQ